MLSKLNLQLDASQRAKLVKIADKHLAKSLDILLDLAELIYSYIAHYAVRFQGLYDIPLDAVQPFDETKMSIPTMGSECFQGVYTAHGVLTPEMRRRVTKSKTWLWIESVYDHNRKVEIDLLTDGTWHKRRIACAHVMPNHICVHASCGTPTTTCLPMDVCIVDRNPQGNVRLIVTSHVEEVDHPKLVVVPR